MVEGNKAVDCLRKECRVKDGDAYMFLKAICGRREGRYKHEECIAVVTCFSAFLLFWEDGRIRVFLLSLVFGGLEICHE